MAGVGLANLASLQPSKLGSTQRCAGVPRPAGLVLWKQQQRQPPRRLCVARATATAAPKELQTLQQAGRTRSVPSEQVEAALQALEAASEQDPSMKATLSLVPGRWQLIYNSGGKFKALHYIPIKEEFCLDPAKMHVSLESELGPFRFLIKGTVFSWDETTGVLDFQFDGGVSIMLGSNQIYEVRPTTKRKTYTFFYASKDVAGARSSAGGLSLLIR